jgi:hypothetical protein
MALHTRMYRLRTGSQHLQKEEHFDKNIVAAGLFLSQAVAALCQTDNCAAHQDVGSAPDHSVCKKKSILTNIVAAGLFMA